MTSLDSVFGLWVVGCCFVAQFLATIVVGSSPGMRNRSKDASGERLKWPEQPSTKAQAADRKPGKVTGARPPLGWALGQEPGKLMLSGHLPSTRLIFQASA
ncbi:hypothetical protein NL676_014348 [Syzygium grande]|nr:hypothetical protein NL676_014348 [Syzygium grande]